jgi:AcrR family transcriptional regulator
VGDRGKERRERVLDAALEVIAERGLAETRMADISERAGMSPGHVLYYFRTKDLVLMEALRHVEDRMHEDAEIELASLPSGPDRLLRLLELNIPDGLADPGWTLWLEAWTLAPHDAAIRSLVSELEERWKRLLGDVIRSGVEAGTFACDDVETSVTRLYAAINGLSVQVVTGVAGTTPAGALDACMRLAASELGFGDRVTCGHQIERRRASTET